MRVKERKIGAVAYRYLRVIKFNVEVVGTVVTI